VICAQCRRPIKTPAIQIGRVAFGPVCARRLGLIQPKDKAIRIEVSHYERDPHTPDLFDFLSQPTVKEKP
jgi:hypothetical protein